MNEGDSKSSRRRWLIVPLVVLTLIWAGWWGLGWLNGNSASVSGTVLLDGDPVAEANINFLPMDKTMGNMAVKTDTQGRFTLNSSAQTDIKPGWYIVLIAKDWPAGDQLGKEKKRPMLLSKSGPRRNILPAKYLDFANPAFTVELKPGGNALPPFLLTK